MPTLHSTDLAALLYTRYRQKMYAVAFGILHSEADAEDAVADAVVRMLRHIGQFTEPLEENTADLPHRDRNEALLCIYTRHAAIDILRRRKPDTPLEDAPDVPDPTPLPEDAVVLLCSDEPCAGEGVCRFTPEDMQEILGKWMWN